MKSYYNQIESRGITAESLRERDVVLTTAPWFDPAHQKPKRPFGILNALVEVGITMIPRVTSDSNKRMPYAVRSSNDPPYTRPGYYLCNFIRKITCYEFNSLPDRIHKGRMADEEYRQIIERARKYRETQIHRAEYWE